MFKSFAVALLSATVYADVADSPVRGKNDASDQKNAHYTSMIGNESEAKCKATEFKMDLFTYIAKGTGENAYEFHGDTVAAWSGQIGANVVYGFCLQMNATDLTWDC